jgi:hypothetical protein
MKLINNFNEYLDQNLLNLLQRLKGITGFISILGDDPRVFIFNRYYHIIRVSNITYWLCNEYNGYDTKLSMNISLLHDINRLPFAHNLEKKINFDQADNLLNYFVYNNINIDDNIYHGIVSLINKDKSGPPEPRLVYAADSVAGFIEDTLFALTTLKLSSRSIPDSVANILGFDFTREELLENLNNLRLLYYSNPHEFVESFNNIAFEYSIKFLNRHNQKSKLFIDLPEFQEMRNVIKYNFLYKVIFPINNELVSLGTKITNEIALPLMNAFELDGKNPILTFLGLTDQETLNFAFQRKLISDPSLYFPVLDLC